MGKYKAQGTIFNLQFEEHPGLEVRVGSCSLGAIMALGDQPDRARAGAGLAEVRELIDLFTSRLKSWNLVDEDEVDVPTTTAGLLNHVDVNLALEIVVAWSDALTAVPDSLGKGSTSGERFPEESIPMAVA